MDSATSARKIRSRKQRERAVYRYLPTYSGQYEELRQKSQGVADMRDESNALGKGGENDSNNGVQRRPESSKDKALNAFAQLGALRLNTKRAIISLIDRGKQYILAEATQSLSPQSDDVHNLGDSLLYGVQTIPRSEGVCGCALEECFKLDSSPEEDRDRPPMNATVIPDLRQDKRLKNSSFVANNNKALFYAGVPIQTKDGFNIGSYCVLDDVSRATLDDDQLAFLNDMACTVMEHLEYLAVKKDHERAERMVRSLGLFVDGHSSVHDWWLRARGKSDANTPQRVLSSSTLAAKQSASLERYERAPGKVVAVRSTPAQRPSASSFISLSTPKESLSSSLAHASTSNHAIDNFSAGPNSMPKSDQETSKPAEQVNATSWHHLSSNRAYQKAHLPAVFEQMEGLFSRASNLIRESIDVDGAVFFDATISGFGGLQANSRLSMGGNHSTTTSSSEDSVPILTQADSSTTNTTPTANTTERSSEVEERSCPILGFSTKEVSSINGSGAAGQRIIVSELFIKKLLKRYPRGKIFAFDEEGIISSSEEDGPEETTLVSSMGCRRRKKVTSRAAEARLMLEIFPGARYIMILPLWDSHNEKWFASSMLWTSDPKRVLTIEDDLNYLVAFANSIMAEVCRLDTLAANDAKTTFISSVSHELRSPLHGILGSIDLLQNTELSISQSDMLSAMKQCSITLLDTINHVLDFAKINSFIQGKQKERDNFKSNGITPKARPAEVRSMYGKMSLTANFNLAQVTEEVMQSICLGHEYHLLVTDTENAQYSNNGETGTLHDLKAQAKHQNPGVMVILDIDSTTSWVFHSQPGAWRRIVMNVFGNALKYTDSGFVKVHLKAEDVTEHTSQFRQSMVTMTVTDSGKGISSEFLNNHLFTPFTQEDPVSHGTGLGLSIVRQIVESLNGKIEFQSKQGFGTSVEVTCTLDHHRRQEGTRVHREEIHDNVVQHAKSQLRGHAIGIILDDASQDKEIDPGAPEYKRLQLLRSSLSKMAEQWFEMRVVSVTDLQAVKADVCIATKVAADSMRSSKQSGTPLLGSDKSCPLVVIDDSYIASAGAGLESSSNIRFTSNPIGPHKFAKVITTLLEQPSAPDSLIQTENLDVGFSSLKKGSEQMPVPDVSGPIQATVTPDPSSLATGVSVDGAGPMLLLVEDNPINLKLLATYMRKLGHRFLTAADGQIAVDIYKQSVQKPALIFMDISMPVMDGFAATRHIRAYERLNRLSASTIVALTGLASEKAQHEAYISGINLFLSKPVPMQELKRVMKELGYGGAADDRDVRKTLSLG